MSPVFDLQPTLSGELIAIRPLQASDFDDLHDVASDPLIWQQHPCHDRWMEDQFAAFFAESLASKGALVVIDLKTNRVIGSSRYFGYDRDLSEIEIGWTFLARAYWGGTYNAALKRLMLRHAFRFVGSVIFLVSTENVRSQRAVEKLGASKIGVRPDAGGHESFLYRIERGPD